MRKSSMMTLMVFATFAAVPEAARGGKMTDECIRNLEDVRPSFDTSIVLTRADLRVEYGSASFAARPREYQLLQIILNAPREMIRYDDLIVAAWSVREPRDPLNAIHLNLKRLRQKFRAIDPEFDQLRFVRGEGVYWARSDHARRIKGRVGAARYVHLGYADGIAISLSPNEHAILTAALRGGPVGAGQVNSLERDVFRQTVCGLNRRFTPTLKQKLLRLERGQAAYSIDPALLRAR